MLSGKVGAKSAFDLQYKTSVLISSAYILFSVD